MATAEIELRDADEEVDERWADVLRAIETKRPYSLAPWQPLSGEPRLDQLAFRCYLDSQHRNLAQVAAQMGMKYADVLDASNLYAWVRRAERYDEWRDRQADEARIELTQRAAMDTAAAYSRLPTLAQSAMQLVEGAVNAKLRTQEKLSKEGKSLDPEDYDDEDDHKPISVTQALRIGEMVRGLLDSTTKFLTAGKLTVEHNHTHRGAVGVAHVKIDDNDALAFLQGLTEAGFNVGEQDAIEASGSDG